METPQLTSTRRDFLSGIFPAGPLACLSCTKLCGLLQKAQAQEVPQQGFLTDSQMSYEEVFSFGFSRYYIPTMKGLQDHLSEDELVEMLKDVSMDVGRRLGEQYAGEIGSYDLATFTRWAKEPNRLQENVLEWEIVEDTEGTFAVKVTECLWAKTFRDAQAADIGYAGICHGDFGAAPGFNSKMRLERTKTLMQGHDCCDHRWVMEG